MIDNDEKLAAFLPTLHSAPWIALDTEADSLHAYPEKVCLIQVSTPDSDVLIDPLSPVSLSPFFAAVQPHELIFHAADYDLRLLRKHHQFVPSAIFDTMLAARLLGQLQFGLGSLVQTYLGVTLDKGPQKADWAQRPLTERMEKYARNDTHFLKSLADQLKAELIAKNRLAWHQESCARLIVECMQPPVVDEDEVWRIKGTSKLPRPALAVVRELWHWREREAIAANRPPFFILSHETLVAIAIAASQRQSVDALIPPRMNPRRRENLLEAVTQSRSIPPAQYPDVIRHRSQRPTEAEFRRFRELERIRDRHARDLEIDPTLIAPKSVLGSLAHDFDGTAATLMSWQRALLK